MTTVGKSVLVSAAILGAAAANTDIQNIHVMRPAKKIPLAICATSFIDPDRGSNLTALSVSTIAESSAAILVQRS
jgi:hypothetical protein